MEAQTHHPPPKREPDDRDLEAPPQPLTARAMARRALCSSAWSGSSRKRPRGITRGAAGVVGMLETLRRSGVVGDMCSIVSPSNRPPARYHSPGDQPEHGRKESMAEALAQALRKDNPFPFLHSSSASEFTSETKPSGKQSPFRTDRAHLPLATTERDPAMRNLRDSATRARAVKEGISWAPPFLFPAFQHIPPRKRMSSSGRTNKPVRSS